MNFVVLIGNLRCSQIIIRGGKALKECVLNIIFINVWNFVIEFYNVRIKYTNKICQHAVSKMFHLELVDTLCSISKVIIRLP